MRIHVRFDEQFIFPIDVPENISVFDFKTQLLLKWEYIDYWKVIIIIFFLMGKQLDEHKRLSHYDIKELN